jgi:hypothetical protein
VPHESEPLDADLPALVDPRDIYDFDVVISPTGLFLTVAGTPMV